MDGLTREYYNWMKTLVSDGKPNRKSYDKLLTTMFDTPFTYELDMDGNRFEDGVGLRYRFGFECGYPDAVISTMLDVKECSVLEMMVALAMQCEEHIMGDPDIGDRTGEWFWGMVNNLGLLEQNDMNFDIIFVENVLERFLHREYSSNGRGGLFTVKHPDVDMREVEIWYQLMWYLDEYLKR